MAIEVIFGFRHSCFPPQSIKMDLDCSCWITSNYTLKHFGQHAGRHLKNPALG